MLSFGMAERYGYIIGCEKLDSDYRWAMPRHPGDLAPFKTGEHDRNFEREFSPVIDMHEGRVASLSHYTSWSIGGNHGSLVTILRTNEKLQI